MRELLFAVAALAPSWVAAQGGFLPPAGSEGLKQQMITTAVLGCGNRMTLTLKWEEVSNSGTLTVAQENERTFVSHAQPYKLTVTPQTYRAEYAAINEQGQSVQAYFIINRSTGEAVSESITGRRSAGRRIMTCRSAASQM
ncbi:hypothetical protein E2C06_32270 [Dankookia rubra]|uniref:Uncharacterized protein n=1 Tax=Dankookia rubra TaxID=1442381 RepID=A0A4R5Q6K8_9PROT|nr:hypothetical protein [Dankookia rubra]TDH58494.1 hypothetical protein E2C06_32270 [Dankookia rubra]